MKIFTKLLLPIFLIASYFTGYGASIAYGVKGEGVYIPKNPLAAQVDVTAWLEKSGSQVSNGFNSVMDLSLLDKSLYKSLSNPKRIGANFMANASGSSLVGLNMINTTQSWDEGRMKPTLSAFPNPSKGSIVIELQTGSDPEKLAQFGRDTYKINFSNTIGQVLKSIKLPNSARDRKIKLDLSEYPAGVYFYSLLVNDKMVETKRLILQQ